MSSSLFLQQTRIFCLSYLDCLKIGGRWPYNRCFVGYCCEDLFSIAHSILVQFPFSFFFVYAFDNLIFLNKLLVSNKYT